MNRHELPGHSAMILAAGLGKRMYPLTLDRPKPLVEVAGKRLIDYAFDRLRSANITRAVVNVHYLAEQVESWAQSQTSPEIVISDERRHLLDTGGGIQKALGYLGSAPFFVLNSDSFWLDGATPALERLRRAWEGAKMDSLLLLSPQESAVGYEGTGDFHMDASCRLTRRQPGKTAPFIYAGCYLVAPSLFAGAPEGAFSMNLLWDAALAQGRLFGLVHDGLWIHVGRPESIAYAERTMESYAP
jgi:N-acetyl-alpha-D-muramate 1-phosphate uridylyltransferase